MRGCLQAAAGVAAFLFVLTAVTALFATNLIAVTTDRQVMKEMMGGLEGVVRMAVPVVIADVARAEAARWGIADLPIDQAQLDTAVTALVPPGWVEAQTETAVDGLYDYLETGDPEAATMTVDVRPVLERLRGEAGQQVVAAVLANLPVCTEPVPDFQLDPAQMQVPGCLPPQVDVQEVAAVAHTAVVQSLEADPALWQNGGVVEVPLLAADGNGLVTPEQQAEWERLHNSFILARTWGWTLWLVPLACLLLIALLAVRSLPEWGHWWGWPMVVTAVIVLFISLLAPAVLAFVGDTADPLAPVMTRFGLQIITGLADRWLMRVYLQAGILLAAGVGLILLAVLAGWVRPRS